MSIISNYGQIVSRGTSYGQKKEAFSTYRDDFCFFLMECLILYKKKKERRISKYLDVKMVQNWFKRYFNVNQSAVAPSLESVYLKRVGKCKR